MRHEHDTRTLELPTLPEWKPATQAQQAAGRGAYKAKLCASTWTLRRLRAGLTMKELAKRAGVGLRTLERLEGQGQGDISLHSRRAIRDALDHAEAAR